MENADASGQQPGSSGDDAASRLALLVAGLLVVGLALGALLGLLFAVATPDGGITAEGTPPTVDPEGGIPPAPEAGGVVGSINGGPFNILGLRTFDPQGDDEENDGEVELSWDGDPETGWSTESYGSPDFGGLKDGVGLVYDLGAPQTVGRVVIQVDEPTGLALYASDAVPDTLEGFERVATAPPAPSPVVMQSDGRTARFWLVWVEELPADGEAALNEVTFVP